MLRSVVPPDSNTPPLRWLCIRQQGTGRTMHDVHLVATLFECFPLARTQPTRTRATRCLRPPLLHQRLARPRALHAQLFRTGSVD